MGLEILQVRQPLQRLLEVGVLAPERNLKRRYRETHVATISQTRNEFRGSVRHLDVGIMRIRGMQSARREPPNGIG